MIRHFYILVFISSFILNLRAQSIGKIYNDFLKEYRELNIPETDLDYSINFSRIQSPAVLLQQQKVFSKYRLLLEKVDSAKLKAEDKIHYRMIAYEVSQNLDRIKLELGWSGNKIKDQTGLYAITNGKEWYSYYVRHFTGVNISPEEVFNYGQSEVTRVQKEINFIREKLGYTNEESFYKDLKSDRFILKEKSQVLKLYQKTDSTVRKNLFKLFKTPSIPPVEAMEWPDATAFTPPGIYLPKQNNPYGADVFQFNFFNQKHNIRSVEWLYLHEAIPGHHMQSVFVRSNSVSNNLFYFGTSEGWACYIERYGKELGLYKDDYSYLGLCEWDLVRSARLVMEVGIHYYGWSYDKAFSYWKENINGQDEIAEREIKRITKWPGQSLCYKVGAKKITDIVSTFTISGGALTDAHTYILKHSNFPLESLILN